MKNVLALMLVLMLMVGCGPNFNEVQMAKIQYDTARITALQQIEVTKQVEVTKRVSFGPVAAVAPIEDKYSNAGFLVETDKDGRIKTLFIGQGVINKGDGNHLKVPQETGGVNSIANAFGYQPKESYMGKEMVGAVKSLAKFGLIGYGINQIAGAVGDNTTTYSAGRDQGVNTGTGGSVSVAPMQDAGNDFSDNRTDYANNDSDNRVDDNSDNRSEYNNDNRYDYDNQTADPTVVDPVIVNANPNVVDPVIVPSVPWTP